jgi:hypothetical protein
MLRLKYNRSRVRVISQGLAAKGLTFLAIIVSVLSPSKSNIYAMLFNHDRVFTVRNLSFRHI